MVVTMTTTTSLQASPPAWRTEPRRHHTVALTSGTADALAAGGFAAATMLDYSTDTTTASFLAWIPSWLV